MALLQRGPIISLAVALHVGEDKRHMRMRTFLSCMGGGGGVHVPFETVAQRDPAFFDGCGWNPPHLKSKYLFAFHGTIILQNGYVEVQPGS